MEGYLAMLNPFLFGLPTAACVAQRWTRMHRFLFLPEGTVQICQDTHLNVIVHAIRVSVANSDLLRLHHLFSGSFIIVHRQFYLLFWRVRVRHLWWLPGCQQKLLLTWIWSEFSQSGRTDGELKRCISCWLIYRRLKPVLYLILTNLALFHQRARMHIFSPAPLTMPEGCFVQVSSCSVFCWWTKRQWFSGVGGTGAGTAILCSWLALRTAAGWPGTRAGAETGWDAW